MQHASVLTALVILTAACSQSDPPANTLQRSVGSSVTHQSGQGADMGRFTIVHSPHVENDTVLLDTVTGKTWLQVEDASRQAVVWEAMPRNDNPAETVISIKGADKTSSDPKTPKVPWANIPFDANSAANNSE